MSAQRVEVYTLEGNRYGAARYVQREQRLAPAAFPEAELNVAELFA